MEITRNFPGEGKESLTDQIGQYSRSVCANFAEAYRRRNYPSHFRSKLADSDAENAETEVWLDFSLSCKYITAEQHQDLVAQQNEVGRLIGYIIKNPGKYS